MRCLRLRLGPDSAGADPGPVAYALGGKQPTVTDANVSLGKIAPEHFAGGKIKLDPQAAQAALSDHIGEPLGLDGSWPAAGVVEIIEENMANAARVHAIEKGRDIAACSMIAFGGGAPLHACRLADKLGIDHVIVPKGAGVGSAIGFLHAPIAFEVTRTAIMQLADLDLGRANAILMELEDAAAQAVLPALGKTVPKRVSKLAMRYVGQGHELDVMLAQPALDAASPKRLRADFEKLYAQAYGVTLASMEVEIVAWSVMLQGPKPETFERHAAATGATEPISMRQVFDPKLGQMIDVPVYWRERLPHLWTIEGPAIIAEDETSTIITSDFRAELDDHGYIHLARK